MLITFTYRLALPIGVAAVVGLASCRTSEAWTTLARPVQSGGEQLSFTATVQYNGIEGGFYELVADHGRDYDPTNLPPQFQRESLRLEVVTQLRPDLESFHGAGPIVTILRLRQRSRR